MGDWLRVAVRSFLLGIVVFGGLGILLFVRLIEGPIHGSNRPWTPWITTTVCRLATRIIGVNVTADGPSLAGPGALVANHASWLDIFVLNSVRTLYFVAKAEVAGWPGIGWLARATGTVFIRRDRSDAARQRQVLQRRIAAGHRLLFFPEGTSTDGLRVLEFKPTLFAAFFDEGTPDGFQIQPVSLRYTAPKGEDPRFYGWWGDMEFGGHLLSVLAAPRQGHARVVFCDPIPVADFADRKSLAKAAETAVRSAFGA
jgi:1-acyl-sn-glycerol-3-phosphate acyltransferase